MTCKGPSNAPGILRRDDCRASGDGEACQCTSLPSCRMQRALMSSRVSCRAFGCVGIRLWLRLARLVLRHSNLFLSGSSGSRPALSLGFQTGCLVRRCSPGPQICAEVIQWRKQDGSGSKADRAEPGAHIGGLASSAPTQPPRMNRRHLPPWGDG